jgi:hypothetical protein
MNYLLINWALIIPYGLFCFWLGLSAKGRK